MINNLPADIVVKYLHYVQVKWGNIMHLHIMLGLTLAGAAISATPIEGRKQANEGLQALDDFFKGDLINDPTSLEWGKWGTLKIKTVDAKETPGQFAVQATIKAKGANHYDSGMNVPLTGDIKKGDRVQMKLWARATSKDGAVIHLRLQQNSAPYDGFGDLSFQPTAQWKLYEFETTASRNLGPKDGVFALQLSAQKQVVEIGQIYLLNMNEVK
jgi:Carbohydrate binding domain